MRRTFSSSRPQPRGVRPRRGLLRAGLGLAASAAVLAFSAGPALAASDDGVPDPLAAGSHPVKKIEYDAGNLLLTLADGVSTTQVPLRGSITYPDDVDEAKIIVFVHGRHGVCIGSPTPPAQICDDETDADGTPTQTDIRSYEGYDYMARNLASHGYTVMSLEANTSSFDNSWRDGGAAARSQIIQANIELLWRWDNGAGPYVAGDPDRTVGTKLVGRLDFSDPIGIMGHSRGGDAVTDYIGYDRNLPRSALVRPVLGAVLALAPVNYTQYKMPYGTNYAVLLPGCDGDVSTLQGARFFENAKYPDDTNAAIRDTFAKVQWFVQGTDHNFYNTVWSADDFGPTTDPACSRGLPTTARLTPADQRRVGGALMEAFMRRYVGNERAFDPIMTGEVTLPEEDGPLESGKGTAEEVKTSYIAPKAARLDVLRPTAIVDPQPDPASGGRPTPRDPSLVRLTATGGPLVAEGLTTFEVCNPDDIAYRGGPAFPTDYPQCPDGANDRSKGNHFTVVWDHPSTLTAWLGEGGTVPRDVSSFGVLDLRVGVNRSDPRNPLGDHFTPNSATQDFTVALTDAAGHTATTDAARWTTSLEPSIGTSYPHMVLNGVRIPLSAFKGVNLRSVLRVQLGFGTLTPLGSIELADMMFQESAKPVRAVVPAGDGSSPLPGPVLRSEPTAAPLLAAAGDPSAPGSPTAAPRKACVDTRKPHAAITAIRLTGRKLVVSGTASDRGCAGAKGKAAGGVRRTLVAISGPRGTRAKRARFVLAGGRLTKPLPISQGVALKAKGTARWSVAVAKRRLPHGVYRIRVSTFDRSGNLTTLKPRTVKVK